MAVGPLSSFEGRDALWHNSAAALNLSLMILAVPYCVTASNRTSCGNNKVLTFRTKTSNVLWRAVVTGSGLMIIEFAGRRVVRQLNTIQAHVRIGMVESCWSDIVQVWVDRKALLSVSSNDIYISS